MVYGMVNGEKMPDFNNFSDEELLQQLRNGSDKAFSEIVKRYSAVVSYITRSYYADALTEDDWFQEGMIGFLNAVKSFDENAGVSFSSYSSVCIKNRINSVWRRSRKNENLTSASLDELFENNHPSVCSPEDDYINNEQYLLAVSDFLDRLSNVEREVFLCYISGYGYQEIARKLGINEKAVDNALCRAKAKMKKSFRK